MYFIKSLKINLYSKYRRNLQVFSPKIAIFNTLDVLYVNDKNSRSKLIFRRIKTLTFSVGMVLIFVYIILLRNYNKNIYIKILTFITKEKTYI